MVNILFALVLTPIVARYYDEAFFGPYYLFFSICTTTSLFITGMYPNAIVLPKLKWEFENVLKLSLVLSIIGTLFISILLFAFSDEILSFVNAEQIIAYSFLIPVGILLISLSSIFNFWNVRNKEFKTNALSGVSYSISERSGQILLAITNAIASINLIASRLVAELIRVVIMAFSHKQSFKKANFSIDISGLKSSMKQFYKYPTVYLAGNFINKFTADLPLFLLSGTFGIKSVGAFGFAVAMLNIPFNVLGGSISNVYLQQANELYLSNKEEMVRFTKRTYNKLLILGSLIFGFTFAFGDLAFSLVFSDKWATSGNIAMILSIYVIFKLVSSPFSKVFSITRKEQYSLYVNGVLAVLRILSIYIGITYFDMMGTIYLFTIANLIGYIFVNYLVFQCLKEPFLPILLQSFAIVAGGFGFFYFLRYLLNLLILS